MTSFSEVVVVDCDAVKIRVAAAWVVVVWAALLMACVPLVTSASVVSAKAATAAVVVEAEAAAMAAGAAAATRYSLGGRTQMPEVSHMAHPPRGLPCRRWRGST